MEKVTLSVDSWIKLQDENIALPIWFEVNGNSMYPLIRAHRDRVMLLSADPAELKVGDIVLFPGKYKGGDYCLHRIHRLREDAVQTMGDGNRFPDAWQPKANILGKAVTVQRGRRTIPCDAPKWQRRARVWNCFWRIRPLMLLPFRTYDKLERLFCRLCKDSPEA